MATNGRAQRVRTAKRRRRAPLRPAAMLSAVLSCVLAASCSAPPEMVEPQWASAARILDDVPYAAFDPHDSITVEGLDLEGLTTFLGTRRPEAPFAIGDVDAWLNGPESPVQFGMLVSYPLSESARRDPAGVAEELGFSAVDLEVTARVSGLFGGSIELVLGDAAVPPGLVEAAPGVHRLGPEEGVVFGGSTPLRRFGDPLYLAERDGWVAMSGESELVEGWSRADWDTSMHDLIGLPEMTRRIDERRPFWFELSFVRHPDVDLLFRRHAVSMWSDDGELRMTLIYGADDHTIASRLFDPMVTELRSGADQFGTPYSSWFTVRDAELAESLIVVTLDPVDADGARSVLVALTDGSSLLPLQ